MGAEAIIKAVRANDLAEVGRLLEADPELLGARSPIGETLLQLAMYSSARDVARLLLDRGYEPDLHEAAILGDVERIRAMLAVVPESVDELSEDGFTALGLAAFFGRMEAVEALLAAGADLQARNRPKVPYVPENTPLHCALAGHHEAVALRLIAAGADVNSVDSAGWAPLHHAAFHGLEGAVRELIARGADVNARQRREDGRRPLDLAVEKGRTAVAGLLRQHGATE